MKNIVGTENADLLEGTNENENIRALGGNDLQDGSGGAGDDYLTMSYAGTYE